MLANKDIVTALEEVGYTLKEISAWTDLKVKELQKMKKGELEEDNDQLNNFFRVNMEEIEISKLSDEKFRNSHLILTPTGFKKILEYKEEGLQHCYEFKFEGFNTVTTDKHLSKNFNDEWITTDKVKVGDKLKVFDDELEVKEINEVGDINCCSIKVDGDEYYLDGVITK